MRLTVREVREQYGGILPPGATLRADDDEPRPPSPAAQAPAPAKPKLARPTRSERFGTLNAFVDAGMADLTGAEVKVWLVLFRDTKGNGLACTGQTDIARRAGLTDRGVRKVLGKLQTKGVLEIVRRGRLNAGPSTYRVRAIGS